MSRLALAACVVLPWRWRVLFPVNSFSANYKTEGVGGKSRLIRFLYRMKKWQYLLYKHCLLHGLNASVAATDSGALVHERHFRLYWLCLNTAYVCEFFMQTLVKRRYMSQNWMLALQQLLMSVSTVAQSLWDPLESCPDSVISITRFRNDALLSSVASKSRLTIIF